MLASKAGLLSRIGLELCLHQSSWICLFQCNATWVTEEATKTNVHSFKAQIKHIKNFSMKNFGPRRTPPQNCLCLGFSCILKGEEAPNIKNLWGQGYLGGGGFRRGVSGKIVYVYAFFRGLGVVPTTPDSSAIQMGGVSRYNLVVYILLSANGRAYFCKHIVIEMGCVSRYFTKVSGSGVDSTLLKISDVVPANQRSGFANFQEGVRKLVRETLLSCTLSGTGDSQHDSCESIRANHSQFKTLFL